MNEEVEDALRHLNSIGDISVRSNMNDVNMTGNGARHWDITFTRKVMQGICRCL